MGEVQTHYRACSLCEATCGIEIQHQDGQILSIKGDRNDPNSQGHICPKGAALKDLHNDPDRLRQPLRRTANGWEQISWETAFNEVADNIKRIQKQFGRDAVSYYLGNPVAHNYGISVFLPFLALSLRTNYRYSASSLDQQPQMMASFQMFGNMTLFPVPDIDRTDYFLCIGANPVVSNGSLMCAPGVKKRLQKITERGKVTVLDPRFTETSRIANEHYFIKPGTDSLFLLSMIHTMYQEKLINPGRLAGFTEGLSLLGDLSIPFTPESVTDRTGIKAEDIRKIAREFAAAKSATIHGRMGICTQEYASLTCWLVNAIHVITGNLDRIGGAMFTRPAMDVPGMAVISRQKGSYGKVKTRVRGIPEFAGEFPVSAMAEEIMTEGESQTKALITICGNLVISAPNGRLMETALEKLDYMVAIDFYLNETTRHANIILPPTGILEQAHYDVVLCMFMVRNIARYSSPLFERPDNEKYPWEIMLELITRFDSHGRISSALSKLRYKVLNKIGADGLLGLSLRWGPYGKRLWLTEVLDRLLSRLQVLGIYDRFKACSLALLRKISFINLLITIGPYNPHKGLHGLTLTKLKEYPHGIELGPMEPCFPGRLQTKGKKIKLVPDIYVKEIERLQQSLTKQQNNKASYQFSLINRRDMRTNNSWMHNCPSLMKGKNRCTVFIHPEDARACAIEDGSMVRVSSRVGAIELEAKISDEVMPGVLCIPHGWGHHRAGISIKIAQEHAGVSINDITDDQLIDTCAGGAVFNGVPVNIKEV